MTTLGPGGTLHRYPNQVGMLVLVLPHPEQPDTAARGRCTGCGEIEDQHRTGDDAQASAVAGAATWADEHARDCWRVP